MSTERLPGAGLDLPSIVDAEMIINYKVGFQDNQLLAFVKNIYVNS